MLYPSLHKIGGLWAVCVVNMGILHRMFIKVKRYKKYEQLVMWGG